MLNREAESRENTHDHTHDHSHDHSHDHNHDQCCGQEDDWGESTDVWGGDGWGDAVKAEGDASWDKTGPNCVWMTVGKVLVCNVSHSYTHP